MEWLDVDNLPALLNAALASQVTQFGIAFSIAAFIHAGRMKKEIAFQMSNISLAVNNLATALRQDLASQAERLAEVEVRVNNIENHKPTKGEINGFSQ